MKNSARNKTVLLVLVIMLIAGCQTVTINNDKISDTELTETHKSTQYSLLLALVPANRAPYQAVSKCRNDWTQLEVSHGIVDTFRTWGVDAFLFMAATDAFGAVLLTMAEPFMQGIYGSGVVLDSQSIRLSCRKQFSMPVFKQYPSSTDERV